jgi:ADP-ribosylglycohydrolase
MRVAPIGLALDEAFDLAAAAARLTHGHPSGFLAAGFFAQTVAGLRQGEQLPTAPRGAMNRLSR